jgi:hypothetical protein
VAAAGQAEVGATDPHPAVGGGVGQHLIEQFAVGLLEGVAVGERAVRLGEATGERIAKLLELTQVEHSRRSRRGYPVRHDDASEPLGDEPGELTLEPPDLPSQLGPGQTLVYPNSFEHSPHSHILSRLEGRCSNP